MPRAFLITHKRYAMDDNRDSSREPSELSNVSTDDALYNLTKLAEVSLYHRHMDLRNEARRLGTPPRSDGSDSEGPSPNTPYKYFHKLFDKSSSRKTYEKEINSAEDIQKSDDTSDGLKSSKSNSCATCGKRYSTASNLARHRQTHRSPAHDCARTCALCGKVYVSAPAYAMHVRTHARACRCAHCGKCFSRPWLLQGHIRTHTGEKPFKCNICNKAFADKSNLRAHVQTHSDQKPHVCGRCGKAFALKSYLYKHEESSCMKRTVATSPSQSPQQDDTKRFSYKRKDSELSQDDRFVYKRKDSDHLRTSTVTPSVSESQQLDDSRRFVYKRKDSDHHTPAAMQSSVIVSTYDYATRIPEVRDTVIAPRIVMYGQDKPVDFSKPIVEDVGVAIAV